MDSLQAALSAFDNPGQPAQPAQPPETPAQPEQTSQPAPAPGETKPADPAPNAEPPGSQPPQGDEDPAKQGQSTSVPTPEQIFSNPKANMTFAQMRVENTNMRRTLGSLASLLGVTNLDQIEPALQALNAKIIEYQAQQQNIPPEILQRLSRAEQLSEQYEQARLQDQALLSFQKVKDTFKINDAKLAEFAKKLNEEGKNPFATPMDLVREYRMIYFDELLKKAQDEAVKEAVERQKKTQNHSTQPLQLGSPPAAGGAVTGGADDLRSVLARMDGK